ncbi:rRNA processing/ribosome biogenesis-domain-containing protein [Flammula alnicola]|nr:rRNA processing/ribosome biogenesis-domain-containing protein [Flammula alnicola]
MEPGSHLKALLQTQLASDASAVRHLPYCISTLTAECLQPSSHLTKWTTRIHALLHSKESGGRWAGLCLAYKSSLLSQSLMIDSAQSWIGVCLPLFSRNEPLPTVKAAIRLLRVVFSTATDIPEFQRQVSLPHVVKFTSALIQLADNRPDLDLKVICMETLTRLIPLYPTTHRASSAALSAFALRYLNGSVTGLTNQKLTQAASQLYAVLPLTGGKVGAVNLWRKSLEETLAFGWEAFYSLRTTFPIEAQNIHRPIPGNEPQIAVPLNQDRLRCSVVILCDLLSAIVHRPIQIPLGNLILFTISLLRCSADKQLEGFVDPSIRAMEVSAVPDVWVAGCDLLTCLATLFPHRLDTHSGRLFSVLSFQLEQKQSPHQRLPFLKALGALLKSCHPLDSPVLPTRLAKAVLPSVTNLLTTSSNGSSGDNEPSSSKSSKGKKRARNYEGDEVFKVSRQVAYPTAEEGEILLSSIDVIQSLFRNPNLSSAMQSIIGRIIISILIALPRMSSSSLSPDPGLIHVVSVKIQKFSVIIGSGTTSVMSKALPFVIEAALESYHPDIQRDIGMLLHPRVPPLLRSMPHVESLSLFKAEESQEEAEALAALVVEDMHAHQTEVVLQDVIMNDHTSTSIPVPTSLAQVPPIEAEQTQTISPPQSKEPIEPPTSHPLRSTKSEDAALAIDAPSPKSTTVIKSTSQATSISTSYSSITFTEQQDEDEEMPTIVMDSDSDDEA